MRKLLLMVSLIPLLINCTNQEAGIRIIKSNVELIDIKDGDRLIKQNWRISPQINPDVFETSSNQVTFYTDLDSITCQVGPEKDSVDFIIVLNEKDTSYTRVKYIPPYLDKLKAAADYNSTPNDSLPPFTYQSKDDSVLVNLREYYNLDSIAGRGSEVNRMINLMRWVHNVLRHDGSSYNPDSKNTIDLIKICQLEERGVNCRMMATVLNECYLAMGYPSRYITCMPKEKEFNDCHVINMVYSSQLEKWIWMDPTFAAYVMDEKGELLGIDEVRERLINDQPLILNPDANWNRQTTQTKDYYLENYMAKNLYRFSVHLNSRYNSETAGAYPTVEYVELLPLNMDWQEDTKSEWTSKKTGVHYTTYRLNNPKQFWQKPVE
ncbi:transglutaminase domain-containing protein [Carboxylicivirga linearis]|uniref:Transglutaminase domain-containing protein n=1 Tax=Carboxylicivirga linearis TaxID=1628157 RepID=A0ABS5K147_9BACT|nr:transglutaminase domain-containing protein [Carboxylicivirga linearis]MBS2100905.1 transglutaminase domain-containing protein [Carboxylicivirga linearis]